MSHTQSTTNNFASIFTWLSCLVLKKLSEVKNRIKPKIDESSQMLKNVFYGHGLKETLAGL